MFIFKFYVLIFSKIFLQSNPEPMSAESFLDRYSLPRIARLIAPNSFYELQQQHKQGQSNSLINKAKKPTSNAYLMHPSNSAHQATNSGSYHSTNCSDDLKADNINNGELFLLYKHLKNYKVYHGVNAKSGTNRKKGIKIPQDFPGEFVQDSHYIAIIIQQYNESTQCNVNFIIA